MTEDSVELLRRVSRTQMREVGFSDQYTAADRLRSSSVGGHYSQQACSPRQALHLTTYQKAVAVWLVRTPRGSNRLRAEKI